MKRTKQDKQFMIEFDQSNRNFLSSVATFLLIFGLSTISLFVSVIALTIAIAGINFYSISVIVVLGAVIIYVSFWFRKKSRKILKDGGLINQQIEKELFELYPEYKNKIH